MKFSTWLENRGFDPEKNPLFKCKDCGRNTMALKEYYMVKDHVWNQAGGGKGMLCVDCLEKRLGRQLTPEDFIDAIINTNFYQHSPKLLSRMGRIT